MRFLNLLFFILWFSLAVAKPSYNEDNYYDDSEEDVNYDEFGESFIRDTNMLWENGTIPYIFQDLDGRTNFSVKEKTIVRHAMNIIESQLFPGCINFTEAEIGCDVCLNISKALNQCKTTFGNNRGNPQMMLGHEDCFKENGNIILHELGHALGLVHEQTSCRDNTTCVTVKQPYLDIFTANGQKILEKYPDKLSPVDQYEISYAYNCSVTSQVRDQYLNYTKMLQSATGVTAYQETCVDNCQKRGEEYFWCERKSTKYNGSEPKYSYCSQTSNTTHLGEECINKCLKHNESEEYFWCNVKEGKWGYCTPEIEPDIHNLTVVDDLPAHCSEYMILDEEERSVTNNNRGFNTCLDFDKDDLMPRDSDGNPICYADNEGYKNRSPRWKGPGYYRIMNPAGTQLPEFAPGVYHCGTMVTGWLNGTHPEEVGVEVERTVCFDPDSGNLEDCWYQREITVTKCAEDLYVYNLPKIDYFASRYCGANP